MAIRRVWVGTMGPFLYDDEEHDYAIRTDGELPGGATELGELTDVVLTDPQPGQGLVFNGTVWVNQYISVLIPAPENFDVVVSETTAECSWSPVPGVDGYNVYLKSNGEFVKQNAELITETTYDIEDLEDGDYEAYATALIGEVESDPSNVDAFNVDSEISTTSETDFSEYDDTTALLVDWDYVDSDHESFEINDSLVTPEYGDKSVLSTGAQASSGQDILIWKNAGQIEDGEVLALVLTSGNTANTMNVIVRASDTTRTFVRVALFNSSNNLVLSRVVTGSNNAIQTTSYSTSGNVWYWVRIRFVGLNLKVKVWPHGDSEPASWTIDQTVSPGQILSTGYVGLRLFTDSQITETRVCDYFAVKDISEDTDLIPVPT